MKKLYTLLAFILIAQLAYSQAFEATMLYNWTDDEITPTSWLGGRYNDIWGFEINDSEFAVMGSTEGVHFFDLTDGSNVTEIVDAFVPGAAEGSSLLHRDYHSYQNYLYTVADEGASDLQIIDFSGLPASTEIVYEESSLIRRAHNIFIDDDQARLYACGVTQGGISFSLTILSLDDPENPVQLAAFPNAELALPYVHDVYVKDGIAYLNCANNGLYVADFNDPENPVLLGTMTDYVQQGYNHAGWLHPDGDYYYLADETHGKDVKVVDVSNFDQMNVVTTINAESGHPSEIPHNLIVRDDKLYVSYYYDGLQVFDLTNPAEPKRIAYYDTYDLPNDASYKGAWGVYPLLPSGNVLLSDMHNGLFVFDKIEYTPPVATNEQELAPYDLSIFPNPSMGETTLLVQATEAVNQLDVVLYDYTGRIVGNLTNTDLIPGENRISLQTSNYPTGMYQVSLEGQGFKKQIQLVITNR